MTIIGFIGLGTMGGPMARHILAGLSQGDALVLNDRTDDPSSTC